MKPGEIFNAEATVSEWRSSSNSTYGFAKFRAAHISGSAICGKSLNGIEAPLNAIFQCKIEESNGKYKVIALIDPEEEILNVSGIVREDTALNQYIETSYDGNVIQISFGNECLRKSHIYSIAPGTLVKVNVTKKFNQYTAIALVEPTALATAPSATTSSTRLQVIAHVSKNWATSDMKDAFLHFQEHPKAPVVANLKIFQNNLKDAGIRRLCASPLHGNTHTSELLEKWSDSLQRGNNHGTFLPEIDRLNVIVEWLPGKGYWRLEQILEPRSLRIGTEGEFVDWVNGIVVSLQKQEATTNSKKLSTSIKNVEPENDPNDGLLQSGKNQLSENWNVDIEFSDTRVGRGTVRYSAFENILLTAELAIGVPIIFKLKSIRGKWYLNKLHRSVPNIPEKVYD